MNASLPPFELFFERHRARVFRFLMVAAGPADADDCFQETFLSALRAYPRLRDGDHLERWILRIASRKAIDHHRRRGRRPAAAGEEGLDGIAVREVGTGDEDLWRAVEGLPPRQRVAVVHRFVFDRPYRQIGELMDCSPETARANVYQGLKKLREEMS
jgi:RNA polymerase sigma factor (sigma-70 family)